MKIVKVALAGFSDVLYHSTGINNLQEILKDNRIHMASNIGSASDKLYKKAKFRPYYFSMSRVKYGGYAQTMNKEWLATIVFDGTKLRQKFYGQSVDYWGEDWRKTADEVAVKDGSKSNRTKYDENEDRIYSDKPYIQPLNKFVSEIHIMLSDLCIRNLAKEKLGESDWDKMYDMLKRYDEITRYAKSLHIPVYYYDNFLYFRTQNKSKAVDGYKRSSESYLQSLNYLFNAPVGTQREHFSESVRDVVYRVIYTGDWRDFKSAVEANLSNSRTGDKAEKMDTDEFISNMRRYKLKDLDAVQSFIAKKFEYLK